MRNTLYLDREPADARLEWANAAGATGYRVYRGTSADFMTSSPAPWAVLPSNHATDADVPPPGGIFFYVVRATDGSTESAD